MHESLLQDIQSAIRLLKTEEVIRVYCCNSAEGIVIASLLTKSLESKGYKYVLSMVRALNENILNSIGLETHYSTFIFAGIGGSELKLLEKYPLRTSLLNKTEINPSMCGFRTEPV